MAHLRIPARRPVSPGGLDSQLAAAVYAEVDHARAMPRRPRGNAEGSTPPQKGRDTAWHGSKHDAVQVISQVRWIFSANKMDWILATPARRDRALLARQVNGKAVIDMR
ncbi:hypothetical protein ACFXPS_26255 [Nocardia sp. NPDC059091]|uniref:hypothetical protein n=1 Tax=Nocardia sp. NPDC059091 TaxID=3346724 RepID=UPI0036AEDA4F